MPTAWEKLKDTIVQCRKCPRLVAYREQVPAKGVFKDQSYWRKPVPGFGDKQGWLLITGLAPAAHGGNRTGRIFTGDGSGRFLFKALHETGFANQPYSESIEDGLQLNDCYITASVKCAPPRDRPVLTEMLNCNCYYQQEIGLLKNLTTILVLGRIAFQAFSLYAKRLGSSTKGMTFAHGASFPLWNGMVLYASYHPSPRNVNTGLLSESMMLNLLREIRFRHERMGEVYT